MSLKDLRQITEACKVQADNSEDESGDPMIAGWEGSGEEARFTLHQPIISVQTTICGLLRRRVRPRTSECCLTTTSPAAELPFLRQRAASSRTGAMDAHATHGIRDCVGPTCPYYPRIYRMVPVGADYYNGGVKPTTDDYEGIFVAPCDACDMIEQDLDVLCPHCRHLRLYHLFVCLESTPSGNFPYVTIGTLEDLSQRRSCRFCEMTVELLRLPDDALKVDMDRRAQAIVLLYQMAESQYYGSDSSPNFKQPGILSVSLVKGLYFPLDHLDSRRVKIFTPDTWDAYQFSDISTPITPCQTAGTRANLAKAKNWLQASSPDDHRSSRQSSMANHDLPPDCILIDVRQECIVRAPRSPKFAALSYVWGENPRVTVETCKSNLEALRRPGSLELNSLPKTISDAMVVCQELDTPYLWVDRLCIVQDDSSQKHDQIGAMGAIYSSAYFTICDAAGANSDYGLVGVGTTSKQFFWSNVQLGNLRLLPLYPNFNWSISTSTWSSRGWTYQEAVLSPRLLVFTPWQMFFMCGGQVFSENSPATDLYEGPIMCMLESEHPFQEGSPQDIFMRYAYCVKQYSRRRLKYASDIYNAFAGIFDRLYSDLAASICGLPESVFDHAILWREESGDARISLDHEGFRVPSWTWASWDGCFFYDSADTLNTVGSVAKWAIRDEWDHWRILLSTDDASGHWNLDASSRPSPEPLLRHIDGYGQRASTDPRRYMLSAWRSCIETPIPHELWAENDPKLCQKWRTYGDFWKEAHGSHLFSALEFDASLPPAKSLLVRTSVAELNLVKFPAHRKRYIIFYDFFILNAKSVCVGLLAILPSPSAPQLENINPGACAGSFTFLALSIAYSSSKYLSWVMGEDGNLYSPSESPDPQDPLGESLQSARELPPLTFWDGEGKPLDPPPVLNVMVVGWEGSAAYRIGIGQILLARWESCNPTFRTIALT